MFRVILVSIVISNGIWRQLWVDQRAYSLSYFLPLELVAVDARSRLVI